ncbi:ABC transporter permease subunit [Desulfurococcus mucosus]|uniref:ABC transporter transmembrane protein n=1 Tax=Desulfurococcus mucosus (strain ATCC 35584 / DSM 2162 / JCM 9187 / O7/1) TaxID=765177 RepID=E8R8K7_DESM0|nr:ABC transporter permease [Desulfurococcus mucosus]ADV64833.1 ABC transporter transmembrane protein [Desulfurococcus mucosus DSM 2162]
MKPFIYDFKRAFIRKATLTALILFIMAGVGLTYMVAQSMLAGSQRLLYNGVAVAELDAESRVLRVNIGLYDNELKPLSPSFTATLELGNTWLLLGRYSIEGTGPLEIPLPESPVPLTGYRIIPLTLNVTAMHVGSVEVKETITMRLTQSSSNASRYYGCEAIGAHAFSWIHPASSLEVCGSIIPAGGKLYVVMAAAGEFQGELSLYYSIKESNYSYTYWESRGPMVSNISGMSYLGTIREALKTYVYEAAVDPKLLESSRPVEIRLALLSREGEILGGLEISMGLTNPAVEAITEFVAGTGVGLFSGFFPIVVLYLGYVLIAKPKTQGALEFILARPITRRDLYLTRYAAGVLVALAAPAVFTIALYTGVYSTLRVALNPLDALLIYLGLAASLAGFYTLCYYIAVEARGASYLAITITLYLLYLIGFQILGFMIAFTVGHSIEDYLKLTYKLYYLSPMRLADLVTALVLYRHGYLGAAVLEVVKPEYIAVATAAWIIVPFTAGLVRFKRKNLAG